MIESTALITMDEIRDHCKEIGLPCSERMILKMHKEQDFPMIKNLARQWESDTEIIRAWRQDRLQKKRVDTSYIEERNQFIPQAEKAANKKHGLTAPKEASGEDVEKWAADWSKTFHGEMESLWSVYVQRKKLASEFAQQESQRIYQEKLTELMGRPE